MGLTQVSTSGIKDATVATADIADNAVTSAKISSGGVQASNMSSNSVTTGAIATGAVTTAKVADGAVTDAKIASGISASKITGLATDSITEGNSTAEVLDTGSNGVFRFLPEGVEKFRIDTNGNVGIGTSFPESESINGSQNLVIMDTTSDGGMNIKTGTSANAQIHFSDTSGNGQGRLVYDHSNDSMKLFTSGNERMRINSDGRVGIGKTASSTFDIETANNANGFNLNCVGTAANYMFNVRDDNVSKFYISNTGAIGLNTDTPFSPTNYTGLELSGTEGGCITFSDDGTQKFEIYGRDADILIYNRTNTKNIAQIKKGGDIHISDGNLSLASGHGIDFSAATNLSGKTSELLDDYEEGTWTPEFDDAYYTSPGTSYNSRAGTYVKVGRMVLARFHVNFAGCSNASAGPFISAGLPFTPDTSDIARRGLQGTVSISGINTPADTVNVNFGYHRLDNNIYYLGLNAPRDNTTDGNASAIQSGDISNGDTVSGTIMYISAS